jgi:hypothetical protein
MITYNHFSDAVCNALWLYAEDIKRAIVADGGIEKGNEQHVFVDPIIGEICESIRHNTIVYDLIKNMIDQANDTTKKCLIEEIKESEESVPV